VGDIIKVYKVQTCKSRVYNNNPQRKTEIVIKTIQSEAMKSDNEGQKDEQNNFSSCNRDLRKNIILLVEDDGDGETYFLQPTTLISFKKKLAR
jgi:hypothetical protein